MEDNKVTLMSFCQLSEEKRTQYTWMNGELVTSKLEKYYSYHLYLLKGFYVELVFDRRIKEIVSIDPILSGDNLFKYVADLQLEELHSL